jgi:transposase
MPPSSELNGHARTAVKVGAEKRHRRSVSERRRIVEQTLAPGTSVARVARARGVNANQVFYWRTLYRRGRLGSPAPDTALLPVTVTDAAAIVVKAQSLKRSQPTANQPSPALAFGAIHVELPRAHLRIEGCVDPFALRAVLESLLR